MRFVLVGYKNSDAGLISIKRVKFFRSYQEALDWCKSNFMKDGFEWFIDGIEEDE